MSKAEKIAIYIECIGYIPPSSQVAKKFNTSPRYVRKVLTRTGLREKYGEPETRQVKILLFDLEMIYMHARIWSTGKQRVHYKSIIKPKSIITWSAKWLCQPEMFTGKCYAKEVINRDDKRILKPLWDLVDEADILIAHNIKGFDKGEMNARFILNGFPPPSPYRMIDTLKIARRNFRFASNSLDYLTKIFGVSGKQETSPGLWDRCDEGDTKAIQEMLDYNMQDVRALEDLYMKIRGWAKSHPNLGLYYDDMKDRCPHCESTEIVYEGDKYMTNANIYNASRCTVCGAYGRDRIAETTAEQKKTLIRSVAR